MYLPSWFMHMLAERNQKYTKIAALVKGNILVIEYSLVLLAFPAGGFNNASD